MREIQSEHREWALRNFGEGRDYRDAVMGVAEEVGELCHALLKQRQGIRGSYQEHELEAIDAVGDIVIYLIDLCNLRGWDFERLVRSTWAGVKQRDWRKQQIDWVTI